jgi:hypothetical protein
MRKFICACAVVAALPWLNGCTKSVDRAQRDVQTAHDRAVDKVQKEQADLQDTKRDAAERIARQERRVEDAARQGNKEVTKEQRELEDAQRAEVKRDIPERSVTIPADRPAHVDVDVNRTPDGRVKIDVNRNP